MLDVSGAWAGSRTFMLDIAGIWGGLQVQVVGKRVELSRDSVFLQLNPERDWWCSAAND